MPTKQTPNLLTDATAEEMNADFEIMRLHREDKLRKKPPTSLEMAAFQQSFNAFINHRKRPAVPICEQRMLL